MKVKEVIEGVDLFERERIPTEIRVLGIASYIQTSSTRRTAQILSEVHPVSHTAVWSIKKFEEKLPITVERKPRDLVAIDETVVKARKKHCVYSAVDVKRNELVMRVYTTRNWLVTRSFVKEALMYCEYRPNFVIDRAPWLVNALKSLRLDFERNAFGKRSKVESVFSSLKQRIKIFFSSLSCPNPVRNWNKFCKLFMLYYNHLRWLS